MSELKTQVVGETTRQARPEEPLDDAGLEPEPPTSLTYVFDTPELRRAGAPSA